MKGFPIFVHMESTRQKKVSRLIQNDLSIIFQKLAPQLLGNVMISVTIVRISPNLANAKVYLSLFPVDLPLKALDKLNQNKILIRKKLAEKIKNQLRIVPELTYYLDDSSAYAEEIDKLLKK